MTLGTMRIPLVFNPKSGTSTKNPDEILAGLDSALRERLEPLEMALPFDYSEAIDRAVKAAGPLIVWGGDGTIHHAAKALLEKSCPVPLAAIPGGSGNGLVGGLKTPGNPVGALGNLLQGREIRMDVGRVDGEPFFNVAGCGFEGDVAHAFDKTGEGRGFLNYAKIVLKLWSEASFVDVKWDIEKIEAPMPNVGLAKLRAAWQGPVPEPPKQAWSLCFANLPQYGNSLWIAPGADPADGILQWVALARPNVFDLITEAPQLFRENGKTRLRKEGGLLSADVRFGGPVKWHFDGEPATARDRAEITLEPRVFRMMVIRGCPWA
jgi:diacylglycerol kinase family enzyme